MRAVAEAPSKAILTGEHFVVHGAWALAAAIPRTVRVSISSGSSFKVTSERFEGASPSKLLPVSRVVESMAREFSIKPTVSISISSSVPGGAGLGSSAATMVAVAAAYSRLNSLGLGIGELIRCSMIGEQQVHGRPSGIDPTVSAHGGIILYRSGSQPKRISLNGNRSLIISYSGKKRSTMGLINRVSRFREEYPGLFSRLTDGVSGLSKTAAEKIHVGDMMGLGSLLTINHAVLRSMGISTRTLDEMVDQVASMGGYGAKLTGAGGGGCVVAVAPEAKEKSIVSGLIARGFETFSANVPAEGVKSWLER